MRLMNNQQNKLVLFQSKQIRRIWHKEEWFFSVVDIVEALTDSLDAKDYWYKMKVREEKEAQIQLSTICRQLKLESSDGKKYATDCVNTKNAFRLIQSIPSKKAEPFKMWLAEVGKERLDEIENPELAQERMKGLYEKKGYSKDWIDKRLRGIAIRQNLTDEWRERGLAHEKDYAILTAEIFHKEKPKEMIEHKKVARRGGSVAGNARKHTEKELGRSVISKKNYLQGDTKIKLKKLKG